MIQSKMHQWTTACQLQIALCGLQGIDAHQLLRQPQLAHRIVHQPMAAVAPAAALNAADAQQELESNDAPAEVKSSTTQSAITQPQSDTRQSAVLLPQDDLPLLRQLLLTLVSRADIVTYVIRRQSSNNVSSSSSSSQTASVQLKGRKPSISAKLTKAEKLRAEAEITLNSRHFTLQGSRRANEEGMERFQLTSDMLESKTATSLEQSDMHDHALNVSLSERLFDEHSADLSHIIFVASLESRASILGLSIEDSNCESFANAAQCKQAVIVFCLLERIGMFSYIGCLQFDLVAYLQTTSSHINQIITQLSQRQLVHLAADRMKNRVWLTQFAPAHHFAPSMSYRTAG